MKRLVIFVLVSLFSFNSVFTMEKRPENGGGESVIIERLESLHSIFVEEFGKMSELVVKKFEETNKICLEGICEELRASYRSLERLAGLKSVLDQKRYTNKVSRELLMEIINLNKRDLSSTKRFELSKRLLSISLPLNTDSDFIGNELDKHLFDGVEKSILGFRGDLLYGNYYWKKLCKEEKEIKETTDWLLDQLEHLKEI